MHLRFYLDENGKRVYTLKTINDENVQTLNAHPARFSPDDNYQKERYECKKRYNLLPTQQPELKL
ncbi:H/ACA ribonucleoprotein complex protein, putative (macronuclear) [Tetrahymena thermophila SB210]|uniref:Nucleolar protein 10 n=1 Tax=Tetrahymena thermophila (strain SB210) TaxID=312017 RepID=W7XIM2_TETTS|nr:H/ACA ribonucleoprotein complex protein, putative [Tetrahymena thermophila SB210]EWS73419.1 H/ACA ribonucleoprotein complex protein, putative [Tetrahymena thermophila SB210]|eukprot:XP_012654035.1 H/ACA ribonucleoprotein complex protein, putative [Tetrahymena thermophila SB210]